MKCLVTLKFVSGDNFVTWQWKCSSSSSANFAVSSLAATGSGLLVTGHCAGCRPVGDILFVFQFLFFLFLIFFFIFAILPFAMQVGRLILVWWLVVILLSGSDSIRRDKKLKLCPGREHSVCTLLIQ